MYNINLIFLSVLSVFLLVGVASNTVANDTPWNSDLNMAKRFYQNNKIDDAIKHVEIALSKIPNDQKYEKDKNKANIKLVALYVRHIKNTLWEGEYNRAIELSNKVLSFSDDKKVMQEVLANKGIAYLGLKKYKEANEAFSGAINVLPDTADLYLGRASLYIKMTCSDWRKACELNKELCKEYRQGISNNYCEE